MSEWKEFKLEDLAEIQNQKRVPLSSMERAKRQGAYPYYGASGIVDYIDDYIFDGTFVLISEDGENLRTRKTPIAFKASGKFWVNNHAHIIKCNSDHLNDLVIYYLKNIDLNEFISGAVQPKLNKASLTSIPFILPKNEQEQIAIAAVLSSLDDKIDLLYRQNKTIEAMAETLFRKLFIEDAEENWKTGKINDLIDILSGFAFKSSIFSSSGTYKLMTIKAIQDGYLETSGADRIEDVPSNMPSYCYLSLGDILLSLTGNVGRCCLVDEEYLLLNQRVAKIYPKNNRDFAFAYILFRRSSTRQMLEEMAKGTAQANLSPIETANIEILIPPKEKLESFNRLCRPLVEKVLFNKKQTKQLEKLRDTLLPKLMNGEVRVAC